MQTWEAITSRRNVRTFQERELAQEDLDRILEAGRRAPSARNWQPWDFIVVTDREQLRELSTVWQGGGHVAGSAATIAMVLPRSEDARARELARFDAGQATMAMMIAAADLEIGSGHSSVGRPGPRARAAGIPRGPLRVGLDRPRLSRRTGH